MRMSKTKEPSFDKIGIFLSAACLIHCMLVPVGLIFIPLSVMAYIDTEWLHILLAILTVPIAYYAMKRGFTHHRSRSPILLSVLGISCLWAALFIEKPHWLEISIVLIGAAFNISAHLTNQKMTHLKNDLSIS